MLVILREIVLAVFVRSVLVRPHCMRVFLTLP